MLADTRYLHGSRTNQWARDLRPCRLKPSLLLGFLWHAVSSSTYRAAVYFTEHNSGQGRIAFGDNLPFMAESV